MARFILVHGAYHGAWCWERVVPLLEARGHRVAAPDSIGMGKDTRPLPRPSLAAWIEQIVALVEEKTILVGHSRGGAVISGVAEQIPDRVAGLVYLAAVLVPNGKSMGEVFAAFPDRANLRVQVATDRLTSTVAREDVAPLFYNTTAPEWVARAEAQLTPEPTDNAKTPMALSEARFGRVRRAYIETLQDLIVPIGLQRRMQEALPCNPVITLDTDHSPFFSAPDTLCDALEDIARRFG